MKTAGRVEVEEQQRWHSRGTVRTPSTTPHLSANRPLDSSPGDTNGLLATATNAVHDARHSISAPSVSTANAHRQVIGNYELGRVLATGDFDCRTRLCTHVTTGVPYVVRVYDKHVLAEAQWMWDRVAESIHVQRKLPRYRHVLEMVECFESNTSVYILMHLFPSMNLTKIFTDEAGRGELLSRLHILSRASTRAALAGTESHAAGNNTGTNGNELENSRRSDSLVIGGGRPGNERILNASLSTSTSERQSFRQLKSNRLGFDLVDSETSQRTLPSGGTPSEERRNSNPLLLDAAGTSSVATTAAIHELSTTIPSHIPLVLVRVFFEQAVKGVAFLHQHGVAHTGLAPDHLLVSPEGLLRLGNMVSSCFCGPGERLHELRGTMHTVAPEALRGEAYDPFLSDAWALGVVFYFMLNRGRYPHDGANTLRHILHGHSRPPRPGLPAVALDLLSRLMQARPEDRLPVDAVLAHPFFTAALPTIEEEIAFDAAEEGARNARPSLHTAHASFNRSTNDRRGPPLDPLSDDKARSSGGGRRWGRGSHSFDEEASEVPTASWSISDQPLRPMTLSSSSASSSGMIGAGLSTTFDNLDATATGAPSSVPDTHVGDLTVSRGVNNAAGTPTAATAENFTPQRRASVADGRLQRASAPPRSPAAPSTDTADFRSRVVTSGNSAGAARAGRGGAAAAAKQAVRPVWRPELAGSLEALEDLAARVIQYHFRHALHKRQYKAETRALMKRGQSVYLTATSSASSRDGLSAPTGDASRQRVVHRGRRHSSLSAYTQPVAGHESGGGNVPTPKKTSSRTLGQRHRGTSHHNHGHHHGSPGHSPTVSNSSPSTSGARWPSSVNFHHSASAGSGGGSASNSLVARTPVRGRGSSSSVIIDTRAGSVLSDNADWEGDSDDGENMQSYVMVADGVDFDSVGETSGRRGGGRTETSLRRVVDGGPGAATGVRASSLTLPSLAATACGTDGAGEAAAAQTATSMRGHGGVADVATRVMGTATSTTLLSLPNRRRSTISAVLSAVTSAGRGSVDRQRIGGGSAVSDGEVCPLCHREPYAIRSIAVRPYASTPYQFNGGTFTTLLE